MRKLFLKYICVRHNICVYTLTSLSLWFENEPSGELSIQQDFSRIATPLIATFLLPHEQHTRESRRPIGAPASLPKSCKKIICPHDLWIHGLNSRKKLQKICKGWCKISRKNVLPPPPAVYQNTGPAGASQRGCPGSARAAARRQGRSNTGERQHHLPSPASAGAELWSNKFAKFAAKRQLAGANGKPRKQR